MCCRRFHKETSCQTKHPPQIAFMQNHKNTMIQNKIQKCSECKNAIMRFYLLQKVNVKEYHFVLYETSINTV